MQIESGRSRAQIGDGEDAYLDNKGNQFLRYSQQDNPKRGTPFAIAEEAKQGLAMAIRGPRQSEALGNHTIKGIPPQSAQTTEA